MDCNAKHRKLSYWLLGLAGPVVIFLGGYIYRTEAKTDDNKVELVQKIDAVNTKLEASIQLRKDIQKDLASIDQRLGRIEQALMITPRADSGVTECGGK